MGFLNAAMVLLVVVVLAGFEFSLGGAATVYKVGDSTGWTTLVKYDYKKWAADKSFGVGDTILFEYNAQYHNVMQVTHADYTSCNASAPFKTYTTGNDSIIIMKKGHYYYFCGIPGHCQEGQKVDIRVSKLTSSIAPGMSPSPAPSMVSVPSPKNTAALVSSNKGGLVALLLLSLFAY
ncbi:hypothetical protein GIB67_017118 [Kingdonia uniflora]|uniref:Phytocyanin domain-containing protein n=1 Tax=Kingdonia uniflora TaxID=39325 RepID=A0A7J7NCM6_9MAGN|nr:hypothetical protein GIB67_017118 [Kingdonia uniflora]